jgi:L-gulonate 3-dehydrogenase
MVRIAIIGAGLIGRAWAIVFARAGHPVTLFDSDCAVLDEVGVRIAQSLQDLETYGLIGDPTKIGERIEPVGGLAEAVDNVGYVQENVLETVEAKQSIFEALEPLVPAHVPIGSSSSGIAASLFTEHLGGRARCLVAHPANPPYLIPFVELVPAPWTDPSITEQVRVLMENAGQTPIVLNREIQGFVLNRLQGALLSEAFRLVEDGYATPEDVDKAVRHGLGLRWAFMGPFETIDLNAPGGVVDYIKRYGPLYLDLARSQADPRPWTEELAHKLETARSDLLPREALRERQVWRDRRLMALAAHLANADKDISS